MIKKGFLLASFAIGVFANIFAQDTLSFKKTRDKNIYVEFLGSSNLIGVSFDSRFTPISPWGYRLGVSYFQGGDSFIKASNSNRGLFFPIEVNFLTSGNKHKLELGLGSNLGIYNEHISFIEKSKDQYETFLELIKALFIMDRNILSNNDRVEADKLALDWNIMERQFQDDKFWYFISNNNDSHQTRIDVLFDFVTEKPTDHADKDYSYRLFQNLYDYCRAQERKDDSVELKQLWKKHGIDNMRAAWEYVIKTNDRLIAWYENNLYYHYVGYLVSVGNQPLDIYNKLENAKQQFSGREWTNDDTEKEFHKLIMDSFKDKGNYLNAASIDGFEYGSKYVFRLLLLFNVETSRQKGQRFAFDSFKKEKWDIEHIDSQNNASLVEHEDRLRWLNNVAYILGIESKLNERKATAKPLYNKCMDFIPKYEANLRGTGIDKQYTDFCKEVLEYFSAGDGAIKNKDSIGNLTLLDYKTNREYQDAPFPYKRHCIIREDKAGKRFMPIGTRNVFLKYYSNSNTESSFIDAMRWSMPDFDGYLREIHNTVDVIFNVFNSNSTETYER